MGHGLRPSHDSFSHKYPARPQFELAVPVRLIVMSSNGSHFQLPRLRDLARRLHLSARPRSASPLGLRLARTVSMSTRNSGHYHDHIIPLPSSPSISPVPSRLQAQQPYALVPRVCGLLEPGPSALWLDLSAPPPSFAHIPHACTAAATTPPASRLRVVCAHLPGAIIIDSTHPYPAIANSLLLAPVLTPAMVLEALHRALHTTRVSPSEWLITPDYKRARVLAACARRLGHGGGQVAWIDFLEDNVVFAGLTRDPGALRHANPAGCLVDEYTWVLLVDRKEC